MNIEQLFPVPDYVKKIALFDDLASRRVMLLAEWGGDKWIFFWNKHSQNWVSLRKAAPEDLRAIQIEIDRQELP